MAPHLDGEREDGRPRGAVDAPRDGDKARREEDHARDDGPAYHVRRPEALEDARHLHEEVGDLDLLDGRAPLDVVLEQMREDGAAQVQRHAAEEEEAAKRMG